MRGLLAWAGAVGLALTATLGTGSSHAAQPGASVAHGSGRARAEGADDWQDASTGTVLAIGATIEASTGEPLEMRLPDGVVVVLQPGASGKWAAPSKLSSETNHLVQGYHFVLLDGELDVRTPPGPKGTHALLLSTRAGTLSCWRGNVHVVAHEDTTAAALFDGALVMGSNNKSVPVYDKAGIVMRKGIDADKARPVPDAPRWDTASRPLHTLALVASGTPAAFGLAWTPVPGAARYDVDVAADAEGAQTLQHASTTDPSFTLVQSAANAATAAGGGAGAWAHVRAVAADGVVGEWSAPRPLRVVSYALPAGAFVARDGAVVLPARTVVVPSSTDGIDIAYEDVASVAGRMRGVPLYWAKPGGTLTLHAPSETPMRIVHVRDAASGDETQLVLARRELRANVDISPKNARPGDPVDARVVVWDPSGRIDPAAENITVEALFDLDPLAVKWQRSGNHWTARFGTRTTDVPSVVRVVVRDSLGVEIGRGVLELAGPVARAGR
jgi:hypothetical protein